MSAYFYDEALTEKIKKWIGNSQIQITTPEQTKRLFEVIADKNDDKPIQLPLICLRRNAGYTVTNPNTKPLSYDGITIEANEQKSMQLNAIPISLRYQLDVFTRYVKEADEYMRNIIFNVVNYPKVEVDIPYNQDFIRHESSLRMESEVMDNSDIPERLIPGQFTRLSIQLLIDDAYLWDVRIRNNVSISADVDL